MSKLDVQTVRSTGDRKLPIFDEIDDLADRIRVRAYNLFRSRGFTEGHDLDDWLAAERELGWPAAELVEEDDEFEIRIALAGFEPEDVSVTATPREIIVKATRKDEKEESHEEDKTRLHWSEFRSNDVFRRIELPADIVVNKVEADLEHGMLEIEAPKAMATKRRKKKVKVTKGD